MFHARAASKPVDTVVNTVSDGDLHNSSDAALTENSYEGNDFEELRSASPLVHPLIALDSNTVQNTQELPDNNGSRQYDEIDDFQEEWRSTSTPSHPLTPLDTNIIDVQNSQELPGNKGTWQYDEIVCLINSMQNHMEDMHHVKRKNTYSKMCQMICYQTAIQRQLNSAT